VFGEFRVAGRGGPVPPHQSLPRPPRFDRGDALLEDRRDRDVERASHVQEAHPRPPSVQRRNQAGRGTKLVRCVGEARAATRTRNVTGPAGEFIARQNASPSRRLVGSKRPRVNGPNVSPTSIGSGHGNVRVATGTRRS
jgi:hypothetical protein